MNEPTPSQEAPTKRARVYRNLFWLALFLSYVTYNGGEFMKKSGGTSAGIAWTITTVEFISFIGALICGIIWIRLKRHK